MPTYTSSVDSYNYYDDFETSSYGDVLHYYTHNPYTINFSNFNTNSDLLWNMKMESKSESTESRNEEKQKEEENMEYHKNGVVFKNNKVYFENYGQTEENAFSTKMEVQNGDLVIFFKKHGPFYSSSRDSEMYCPAIVFDVDSNSIIAARIADGKVERANKDSSSYRTIVPNEYLKEILKQIFDDEGVVRKYEEVRTITGVSISISHVAYEFGIKYSEYKQFIKGPRCSICGCRSHEYKQVTIDGERKTVCFHCYDSLVRCNRCGNCSFKSDVLGTRDGRYLCKECSKYHFITPYHRYYPKIDFFGNNKNNEVPYLGMELEVDFGGESDTNAGEIVKILNKNNIFAYCSHDGSLNDGFEIITQPATMEYHNSIKHVYSAVMNKLKEMKYSSHNTSTCGMHVHFNRSFFGMDDTRSLSKFIFITEKFWNELVVYSRRPEFRMERYAKKIAPMPITEYINMGNKRGNHDFHYYSVNITNNDTIELRTFKGTLNVNTILATLQLVNNMVIVAKNKSLSEIQNMRFEDFLTTKYQKKYWERHKLVPDGEE